MEPELHRTDLVDELEQATISLLTLGRPAEALPFLNEALETLAASPSSSHERTAGLEQLRHLAEQAAHAASRGGLKIVIAQDNLR
jgi:hypothetical protein